MPPSRWRFFIVFAFGYIWQHSSSTLYGLQIVVKFEQHKQARAEAAGADRFVSSLVLCVLLEFCVILCDCSKLFVIFELTYVKLRCWFLPKMWKYGV
jgi:hypothetical protein